MSGRKLLAGAALLAVAGVCVSSAVREDVIAPPPIVDYGSVSLVAFDSCDNALTGLRSAMAPYVSAYGLGGNARIMTAEGMAAADSAGQQKSMPNAPAPPAENRDHSTTNVHEQGVDEPDLVKTDGKRVVSITDGKLRVVDVDSRTIAGTLDLGSRYASQLLVAGDRALVIVANSGVIYDGAVPSEKPVAPEENLGGTELVLVDLKQLKEIGSLKTDGFYLDARQIGGTARVVVRSAPRLPWVYPDQTTNEAGALRRNRELLQSEPISSWLPRYELTQNGAKTSGTLVDCANVSHPAVHSAASMLTVLTFELSGQLGTGQPVSIVADGDTVYGTDRSLYIADDHHLVPELPTPVPRPITTAIHQFDISQAGPPKHVASGDVAGSLLNQYSLSENEGVLRVATSTGTTTPCCWRRGGPAQPPTAPSQSSVTTLRRDGDKLTQLGRIDGLGKGERIYSVRFIGRMGYVVTFKQTDPLYTLDLSDPQQPKVVGELKITGYSAYLHPAGDGRLIGVGQEATEQGRVTGTQVSLFDVRNPASPQRLAQYHLPRSTSEAEFDPHAFLYWPSDGTLVIPVSKYDFAPSAGSLVLRVQGNEIKEVGTIVEPQTDRYGGARRTIVIGGQLWSVSAAGVQINALNGLAQQSWLPF